MECLHGKPASSSTTKKGSFWFCEQKPSCGFICSEDEGYTFQRALEAWRSTNVEQPVCDEHRKPARFRVVKDLQKESYGRPYFTCADCESPCSLWMWADKNQVEKSNCHHELSTAMKRVRKDGPNKGRLFFCCVNEKPWGYFQMAPQERFSKPPSRSVENRFCQCFNNDY